jgi:lysophospholipase L1-like esterase
MTMARMAKPRRLALVVVLVSTLLSLVLAELVTRRTYGEGFEMLIDPYEEHIYRPFLAYDQTSGERTVRFYTNSLGWKDDRPGRVVAKQSGKPRIVFLGDSFAEGLGVAQKDSVPGVVQQALGPGFEVLNGGRSSYSPLIEYQRLKRFLEAGYQADAVVLMLDVSDVQDELYYSGRYLYGEDGEPLRLQGRKYNPLLLTVYNESALVRSLARLPEQLQALRGGGPVAPGAQVAVSSPRDLPAGLFREPGPITVERYLDLPGPAVSVLRPNWMAHPPSLRGWADRGLRSALGNILRAKRLADARRIEFLVVIYPWPQMLYNLPDPEYYEVLARTFPKWFEEREYIYGRAPAPVFSEYQRRVHRFCRSHGIPLLDLVPEFQEVDLWHRLFIPDDVHFNEEGSRLAGRHIASWLNSR